MYTLSKALAEVRLIGAVRLSRPSWARRAKGVWALTPALKLFGSTELERCSLLLITAP